MTTLHDTPQVHHQLPLPATPRSARSGPVLDSVLDAVGGTPLIRLRRVAADVAASVYVKAEFANPGGSVKDRAALAMVRDALRTGALRPGGTIVEGTSGNTGTGLAVVGAQLGHPVVVVVPDKTSREKVAVLRAHGARVVVTTGGVPRDDPRHVSQVAARLAEEVPDGWLANQYDNPANPRAHRETTGPEVWEQTAGRLTTFVAGIGTGGTVSGAGEALTELSGGRVRIVGVDPESSRYSGGDGSPYAVESIGHYLHPDTAEDVWPASYHPEVLHEVATVTDREVVLTGLRLAREEGLLVGGSGAAAVAVALREAAAGGPDDVVVALVPDSGRAYLSKYYDDEWLQRNGFQDAPAEHGPRVRDVLPDGALRAGVPGAEPVVLSARTSVADALAAADAAGALGRTPLAVAVDRAGARSPRSPGDVTGSTTRAGLRALLREHPERSAAPLGEVADPPLPVVGAGEAVGAAARAVGELPAAWVLVDGRLAGWVRRARLAVPEEPAPPVEQR